MTYRIFVSHSAADIDLVNTIRAHAEGIGVETYFYERDSQAGRKVSAKLREAIRRSDAVLAVFTDASAGSAYLHQEIGVAIGLGKPVLPLIAPTADRPPMAMLEGDKYIALDPADPAAGTAALVQSLHKRQMSKVQDQLLLTVVIIAFVILLFWSTRTAHG